MAKIIVKNLSLLIPIVSQSRLFQKNKNFSNHNLGSQKIIKNNKIYSKILDDVSFECENGDNIGLLGHNGSGKTTLLKVLAGIFYPTIGSVKIEGSVSSLLDINSILKTDCTGYENIKLFWLHYNKSIDLDILTANVEKFSDLGDFLNMPVKIYSSGMAARLLFSLATFIKPDILLTDEGLGAGDQAFKEKAQKIMQEYLNSAKIKVFASHQLEFIKDNCNKVFLIKKGKLKVFNNINEGIKYYNSIEYKMNG